MYLCFNCFGISSQRECICDNPRLEKIDDDIIDIIALLNLKGYKTTDSCSGHISQTVNCVYVYFAKKYDFKTEPEGFDVKSWNDRTIVTFYKRRRNKTDIEIYSLIKEKQKNLREWAENLEILFESS